MINRSDKPIRRTARAVIIHDQRLLVIHRSRKTSGSSKEVWLSIPGGGVEPNESTRDAVIRELYEELGLVIRPRRLLLVQRVRDAVSEHHDEHHYYICDADGATSDPRLQDDSEEHQRMTSNRDMYRPEWVPYRHAATFAGLYQPYRHAFRIILMLLEGLSEPGDFRQSLPLRQTMTRRSATDTGLCAGSSRRRGNKHGPGRLEIRDRLVLD